jgi:hypothetical protein
MSIARSIANVASGRPAPRYADAGGVLVTMVRIRAKTRGVA